MILTGFYGSRVLNVKSKVWYTMAYVTGGNATDVAVIEFGLNTKLKVQ